MSSQHSIELQEGSRFAFGENWSRFLSVLNEERIELARQSLCTMLRASDLQGKRFLDIGSGSGLFSLVARRLGATVHSFDYDPQSVACTRELKRRYFSEDPLWAIEQGDVLDKAYLAALGTWDIVYSWGVLHHTGQMWQALENVAPLVAPGGKLFIAIYNDQGRKSERWLKVKQAYNRLPRGGKWIVLWPATLRLWGRMWLSDFVRGRPFSTWRNYSKFSTRGMSAWRDVVDWVGGLPYEVSPPEKLFHFYRDRGFHLDEMVIRGNGHGCNEFVFVRQ